MSKLIILLLHTATKILILSNKALKLILITNLFIIFAVFVCGYICFSKTYKCQLYTNIFTYSFFFFFKSG